MKIGFDYKKYVDEQSKKILERIKMFNNKLYLEFGGKLFDDLHAARVLPGFDANVKTQLLLKLKDQLEVIFCINAGDIERNKMRADFGITYDMDILRIIHNLRSLGIYVSSIVITLYNHQPAADIFKNKLERNGQRVYIHTKTKGYPNDVNTIVSDEGYGLNPYIETTRPLVIINAPGPGSGKLGTCLSQLYHELKRGNKAGYAKFETFPVWDLPLTHPVNVAYEAATADIKDKNLIDSFHLEKYGISAVNYNRDLEVFPVVKDILTRILGNDNVYCSPTDMGVNMIGKAIIDDEVVRNAAKQEVIRRYFKSYCDYKKGLIDLETAHRIEILMKSLGVSENDRQVVAKARAKAEQLNIAEKARTNNDQAKIPVMAIELDDGTIVTGKQTELLKASATVILNAIKVLSNINDELKLLMPDVIAPITYLKENVLGYKDTLMTLEETLIALSINKATNAMVDCVMNKLQFLHGCEAHSTVMLDETELQIYRKLGINVTCDPIYN